MKIRNRKTGVIENEKVYGGWAIALFYGEGWFSRCLRTLFGPLLCGLPVVSKVFGWWQRQPWTKGKIAPFIEKYHVDPTEFADDPATFASFDDFFVRKLKATARSIATGESVAVIPADGRYRFYPNLNDVDNFVGVKGATFPLEQLLGSEELAAAYEGGAAVIGRLAPPDYHRFHFPCSGIPGEARLINGPLYSVNPKALAYNTRILAENKRIVTLLMTEAFGQVALIEVGATNVGSIHQTYTPGKPVEKGEEKGFFSFGGSALVVLFAPGTISFEDDLLNEKELELRCLMGEPMGSNQDGRG